MGVAVCRCRGWCLQTGLRFECCVFSASLVGGFLLIWLGWFWGWWVECSVVGFWWCVLFLWFLGAAGLVFCVGLMLFMLFEGI